MPIIIRAEPNKAGNVIFSPNKTTPLISVITKVRLLIMPFRRMLILEIV